jgi:hypothetical protein
MRAIMRELESCVPLHITIHRALDTIPTLLPTTEALTFEIVAFLLEFIHSENAQLVHFLAELLDRIFSESLQEPLKLKFILTVSGCFSLPAAEPVMRSVCSFSVPANCPSSAELYAAYSQIVLTCPDLEATAAPPLVALLPDTPPDTQKAFITAHTGQLAFLTGIWPLFFAPESPKFSQALYDNCFDAVLKSATAHLENPDSQVPLLTFLQTAAVPERQIGALRSNRWFLLRLMPGLSALATHESREVRDLVQSILSGMTDLVASLL